MPNAPQPFTETRPMTPNPPSSLAAQLERVRATLAMYKHCTLITLWKDDLADVLSHVETLTQERDEASNALAEITAMDLSGEKGKGWKASAQMQGAMMEMFVASMVDAFKDKGGPNYVEASLRDVRDGKKYFCIIGPHSAKSPHTLRQEAEAEVSRLTAELAAMKGDKERLDWLERHHYEVVSLSVGKAYPTQPLRVALDSAIDAARGTP
jgi:hypothetical protein